ncbi:hypothetical protein GMORB2_0703 [Geosmithia morbida]|uniref:Uncharacterized protein n=1 Tax=Geosmithia morbida TaxID=1094350 RepID=A0A9P4Z1H3_9HYPO|nr:uncharacterized protein GMORB2_0703 [Geosmithia morbida]KAF4126966.1 hypothetical protein GMORB2_0703 [Geosmithia morbida]
MCLFPSFVAIVEAYKPMQTLIHRYPGLHYTWWTQSAAGQCGADDPSRWEYSNCTDLMQCTLSNMADILKSDIAIGTTIPGLLPSILAVMAIEPDALVRLCLVAPHRAVAVASFSSSFPASVFFHLRTLQSQKRAGPPGAASGASSSSSDDYGHTSLVPLANHDKLQGGGGALSWRHICIKLAVDAAAVVSAAAVMRQLWIVNRAVLVQWRCESPLMVITWPMACIWWLPVAVSLLYIMAEDVRFEHAVLGTDCRYTWWQVVTLPYTLDVDIQREWQPRWTGRPKLWGVELPVNLPRGLSYGLRSDAKARDRGERAARARLQCPDPASINKHAVIMVVTMPDDSLWRTWRSYNFLISIPSLVIYFYATFVLLSAVFIGSVNSILFSSLSSGLYLSTRILVTIF